MNQQDHTFMPDPINLPSGIVAKVEVMPAPQADKTGRYIAQQDSQILVSLFRDGALIETRPWNTVIFGAANVQLADRTALDVNDLSELDLRGWRQMIALGLLPTALVG